MRELMSKDGARNYLQMSLKHKDGSWRTVEAIGHNLLAHEHINGVVFNYRDITDRVKTHQALRLSEERYLKAFGSSPDSITIAYISSGRILDVNTGFEVITGYARDEVIGKSVMELGILQDPDAREALLAQLHREGAVRDFEAELVAKDGEIKSVLISAQGIELAGEPCLLSVTRDVTLQKVVAEELYKASEALRDEHKVATEKNAALRQVLDHLETDKVGRLRRQRQQLRLTGQVRGGLRGPL